MAEQVCGHEGCTCGAREDGYCSDYCAGRDGTPESHANDCGCGHSECQPPTKAEDRACIADLAPAGRFVGGQASDA